MKTTLLIEISVRLAKIFKYPRSKSDVRFQKFIWRYDKRQACIIADTFFLFHYTPDGCYREGLFIHQFQEKIEVSSCSFP